MQRRELAIAGGGKIGKDRVTRLLAAEFIAALVHLFKHIAVADTGTNKTHAVFAAELMQPQIRHHRCHDRAAAELAATLHIRAADSEHLVTVDDAALLVDEKAAVGIAVECNTNIVAARNDLGGKIIKMRRTAVVVDVYAVRLAVDKVTEAAEASEQLRLHLAPTQVGLHDAVTDEAPFEQSTSSRRPERSLSIVPARWSM